MALAGVIEVAVGAAILAGWSRPAAYVASARLLGAITLARLAEVRQEVPAHGFNSVLEAPRQVTA